jgi:DNA-binding SARP family transcriptional activator/tetratricopeptide (TPR) repeat protein
MRETARRPAHGPRHAVAVAVPATRVEVCGSLVVCVHGRRSESGLPGRRGRQLVAYLAINRHRSVRREELIDALWRVDPPLRPEAAFATLLTRTRAALGTNVIVGGAHLQLQLGPDPWLDWEVALRGPDATARALSENDPAAAISLADEALAIVERGFLLDLEAEWIEERRRELGDLRGPLCEVLARAALSLGGDHVAAAERAARTVVELEPYREGGYALLMEALVAGGNDAAALQTYDELRTLLREHLGLTPAPAVTALAERVLRRQDEPPRVGPAIGHEPATPVELPRAVAAIAQRPLAGREAERERLLSLAAGVAEGERRVALVSGEAGIGKTRLAVCLAAILHGKGWSVLYGRADRESPLSFQPVLEALRHYLAHRPALDPELEDLFGPELAALSRHVPALRSLKPEFPGPPPLDADLERLRLFEGVAALLASATVHCPALLVLDDLHWADRSTLTLLRHVVHSTVGCRLLVLGTYRDDEDAVGLPLREFLDELWHAGLYERVALSGLALAETHELVREQLPGVGADLIARLQDTTDGNPFYVEEILRGLAERRAGESSTPPIEGNHLPVPDRVKQMIEWRVERLPAPAPGLLKAAAVLGAVFDVGRAAAIANCAADVALEVIEHACHAGLVSAVADQVDRYTFRHALVREAVHEATAPGQRARMHLAAGELLEAEPRGRADAAELAMHFSHALMVGGAERAVHWGLEAGADATRQHAHEESVEHHRRALEALDLLPGDDRRRACILLGEGRSLVRARELEAGQERLREAAELARRVGAADILADSVLDSGAFYLSSGAVEADVVQVLEEARKALRTAQGNGDRGRLSRVTARLAVSLYWDDSARLRRERLAEEAIQLAETADDPGALAMAVGSRHSAHWVSERPGELLDEAERTIALAQEAHDEELELVARTWRVNHLLSFGDVTRLDDEIERFTALADRLRQPRCAWYSPLFGAIRAMMNGRLDEAESLVVSAAELGGRVPGSPSPLVTGAQVFILRWLQGRLRELEPVMGALVEQYPAVPAWRCALAFLESELGELSSARLHLDELTAGDCEAIPRDNLWLTATTLLSCVCARTGAEEHAAALEQKLRPLSGLCVVIPTAAWLGPIDRMLGCLAAVQGRPDEALADLERAAAACEHARSPVMLTVVRLDIANTLHARGATGDAEAARASARAALTGAERMGMRAAVDEALRILALTSGGRFRVGVTGGQRAAT